MTLREAVAALGKHHGPIAGPPTDDPFELVLWQNVVYLARPERRLEAFELLRRTVGTTPEDILRAKDSQLERVTGKGILAHSMAARLRECAALAIDAFGDDLDAVVRGPEAKARRALRRFPGIGEPWADAVLLFTGRSAVLAPDSNALRVLVRLGLLDDGQAYAKTYAASRALAAGLPAKPKVFQQAHLLLQHHGRTTCRQTTPRCEECPLVRACAHARAASARS